MKQTFPELERRRLVESARKTLWTDEGADALKHLLETRRISPEELRKMRWGYAPVRSRRWFQERELHDVSGRIIMPLYDAYGELLAVTARDYRENVDDDPFFQKHWNESFDKRNHLFGLNFAKDEIVAKKAVIVVEGQFDVAYLRSIGIRHAVAAMGGGFSLRHVSLLARYCSTVYLMFDGDKAGRGYNDKVMALYEEYRLSQFGLTYLPVETPWGCDPDDMDSKQVTSLCLSTRKKALAV